MTDRCEQQKGISVHPRLRSEVGDCNICPGSIDASETTIWVINISSMQNRLCTEHLRELYDSLKYLYD